MDVSIIIVNYNTKQLLSDCLNSIYEQTKDINFEVIVSDNGSTDGSIEMLKNDFPQIILIENNANLGFGTANNRGLAIAKGKYIFYLNSDTILLNNAVKYFFDYWEENNEKENIGALGCNLLDKDMEYNNKYPIKQMTFSPFKYINDMIHQIYGINKQFILHFITGKRFYLENKKNIEYKIGKVLHIIGACLFLKNNKYAYFDEEYFMYYEETDLEYKLTENGYSLLLIDSPSIIHLEGASSSKPKTIFDYFSSFSYINKTISQIYFFKKHGESKLNIFIMKFLVLILWLSPALITKNSRYIKQLLFR